MFTLLWPLWEWCRAPILSIEPWVIIPMSYYIKLVKILHTDLGRKNKNLRNCYSSKERPIAFFKAQFRLPLNKLPPYCQSVFKYKQKRQFCCLAKSSQLCVSFWFKWKTRQKPHRSQNWRCMHHATEEYFWAQHSLMLRSLLKHVSCWVSKHCVFTPGVAPGPDETWRVSKLTLTFKKESPDNLSSGHNQGRGFLLINQHGQSQDLSSLKPQVF